MIPIFITKNRWKAMSIYLYVVLYLYVFIFYRLVLESDRFHAMRARIINMGSCLIARTDTFLGTVLRAVRKRNIITEKKAFMLSLSTKRKKEKVSIAFNILEGKYVQDLEVSSMILSPVEWNLSWQQTQQSKSLFFRSLHRVLTRSDVKGAKSITAFRSITAEQIGIARCCHFL